MSVTNTPRVTCLTCNSKVEISSTKNIYKTKFTRTGKRLASFVSLTLSLAMENLRSSYLCLQCLNLFGKLEEASRKANNIKYEIHKMFQDSYNREINSLTTIGNATKDTLTNITNTQVSFPNPRAVITQYTQNKSIYNLVKKKTIINHLELPTNLEEKNTNIAQLQNDHPGAKWINVETYQQFLKPAKMHAEAIASTIPFIHEEIICAPNLKDHQYTQLPRANKVLTSTDKEPVSMQPQKLAPRTKKKGLEPKKPEVPKPESYSCSSYGTKNGTTKHLKLHYKTHSEMYPYMCEKCGKVYKEKKSLKIHINTHDRLITQYTCTTCNKCFTKKAALERHLPMHTRENPYECEICSKKFVHHTSFEKHILIHTQEKKHKCYLCPYAYMPMSNFKRHMRIRSGAKNHICEICDKRFFERYGVVDNMKVHDPEQNRLKEANMKRNRLIRRRCERCKIDFASAGAYNVHLHKHTPENLSCDENKFIHGIQLEPSTDSVCPPAE